MAGVEERIEAERAKAITDLVSAKERMAQAAAELVKLDAAESRAWAKLERSGESNGKLLSDWERASVERHAAATAELSAYDRIAYLVKRIALLESPDELERRRNVSTHMKEVRKMSAKNSNKQTAKDQGVPEVYLAESGNFRTGMDARYKSDLVLSVLGEITAAKPGKSLQVFDPADAEKRLQARGWTSFLDRKREILAAKAAAAEKKAAEKKQAAKDAAAAKKDAAKDEPKSDAGTESVGGLLPSNEVKPDPKPAPKPRGRKKAATPA